MTLPSREQCLQLLHKYKVPENIVRHSLQVERVAVFLARKMKQAGEKVDVELVGRAALLHDIDKTKTLEQGFRHLHGKISRALLEKEGFPKIGAIAEKHHIYYILGEKPFSNWEEKIVYYADKRVNHDQIVSLEDRFKYLAASYGKTKEKRRKIASCGTLAQGLEKEIFNKPCTDSSLSELK